MPLSLNRATHHRLTCFLLKNVLDMARGLQLSASLAMPALGYFTDGVEEQALKRLADHKKLPVLLTVQDWMQACKADNTLNALVDSLLDRNMPANAGPLPDNVVKSMNLPQGLGSLWRFFNRDPQILQKVVGLAYLEPAILILHSKQPGRN